MQTLNRALSEWFIEAYSVQLLFLVIALVGIVRHLVQNADTLPERRFIGLAVLAGMLTVLVVGAAFRTLPVAGLLGLPSGAMNDKIVGWSKGGLALAATWLSLREARRASAKKPMRACWSKGIALGLAVIAVGAYFRFGDYGFRDFYHRHEFFHYYLGAKYHRELGYERLYQCAAIAQAESGQANEVKVRKMMDLATEVIVPAKRALEHPAACRDHFTTERWETFKSDVRFFRNSANLETWNGMQVDHGYNPPPVWALMGHFWSTMAPPSVPYFQLLASFDLALWVGMFAAIYWAFGWRVFAVAALYWGCQAAAEYSWTGGAFLRQDWLFWLVLSACLLRKRWYAMGGAAFAYATLLRVFPGVLLAGMVVVALAHSWKHRRIATHHARLILGGLAATAILVPISIVVTGPSAYPEFYKHIQIHNHSPLTNNMGLATVLSQTYAGRMAFNWNPKALDPCLQWQELRRDRLQAMRPLHIVLVLVVGVAFAFVVRRVKSLWTAQVLALPVLIAVVELTDYYYSVFLLAALLSRHRRGVEQWVLCIAGVSQLIALNRFFASHYDDLYTALSVLYCLFALSLLGAYWRKRGTRGKALVRVDAPA